MITFKRLLAASDLSIPSRHAAERAALLSKELDARLDLLHVIGREPLDRLRHLIGVSFKTVEQQMLDNAHAETRGVAEQLNEHYGVKAGVHLATGTIPETLNEQVDVTGADLLVVGARGASFMRHALLGSTAERLVRKTRQPILVVKRPPHAPYRHVLVPIDFSEASLRSIMLARAIAPNATLILLHIFDVPFEGKLRMAGVEEEIIQRYRIIERQESLAKMHQLVIDAGLAPESVTLLSQRGDPWLHILEQEQEHDIDLIVMGKHGKSRFEEFLLGSVTKHVLVQSQCDVLISI
jgi:nucleotide-binding universal stress UspA family protein